MYHDLEEQMKGILGTKVCINHKDAKKGKSYLLSQTELKKEERDCYVVGEDLPAGKYITGKRTGEGIITCLRHSDAKVRFEYHCGYGYYA